MNPSSARKGFTIVELMIVVAIISFIAAITIPKLVSFVDRARAARLVGDFSAFAGGARLYRYANQDYPHDTHNLCPTGFEDYMNCNKFNNDAPLGGHWNWEGADRYGEAAISIFEPDNDAHTVKIMTLVDEKIDDGDLATGNMQYTQYAGFSMWRLVYVIESPWVTCGGANPSC